MKEKETRTIGIAGSVCGSGTTHLSVALASYAAGGLNETTAYLELNGQNEMEDWKETGKEGYFIDHKIHYYPNFKREQIPILLNRRYEKIIMDFGDGYLKFREEILRCDRKVFLLNLNCWQEGAASKMASIVQRESWGGIKPVYAGFNAQKEIRERIEKEFRVTVAEVPFIRDPRKIKPDEFFFMNHILGRQDAKTRKRGKLIPIGRKK